MGDQWTKYDDTVWLAAPLGAAPHMLRVRERYLAGEFDVVVESTDGSTSPCEETFLVPAQRRWRESEIRRLKDELPYPLLRRLLDLTAEAQGQWVAKSAAEEGAGENGAIQLRNELSALTKTVKRLFGNDKWPMEWKKERRTFHYRMPELMGRWWLGA